ncbi:MAG: hypothetical protein Q9218_007431, partial [Villophora microphyllina]
FECSQATFASHKPSVRTPYKVAFPSIALTWSVVARQNAVHRSITWCPCTEGIGSLFLACGFLMVPLDYLKTSSNTSMKLEMAKISATKHSKEGATLTNPGGPGQSGRELLAGLYGPALQVVTDGVYDLIGFDPRYCRETGNTIPFACFANDSSRARYNIKIPLFLNASDTAIGSIEAARETATKACQENANDISDLLGTGYVTRDVMQFVDALDEGGLWNYWEFSYGTVLGVTVAAMFPDRMGQVVLDGNFNPNDYFAGRDGSHVTSSDISFDGFFTSCAANPRMCMLVQPASSADGLSAKVYDLIYALKYHPFVTGSDVADITDYNVLKGAIQQALYNTSTWPTLATALHGLLTENVAEAKGLLTFGIPPSTVFPNNDHEAKPAIRFSNVQSWNPTSLQPLFEEFYTTIHLLGDALSCPALSYGHWPYKAKGGCTGNFNIKTKAPILVVGRKFDPITPLAIAQNASTGFEGSRVLQYNQYQSNAKDKTRQSFTPREPSCRAFEMIGSKTTIMLPTTIDKLSNELLQMNIADLAQLGWPKDTILNARLVCRRFENLIQPQIFRTLNVSLDTGGIKNDLCSSLIDLLPHLPRLKAVRIIPHASASSGQYTTLEYIPSELLAAIDGLHPRVSMEIELCDSLPDCQQILERYSSFYSFHFTAKNAWSTMEPDKRKDFDLSIILKQTNLTCLDLNSVFVWRFTPPLSMDGLDLLQLNEIDLTTEEDPVQQVLNTFTNLRVVRLGGTWLTAPVFDQLKGPAPNLDTVALDVGSWNIRWDYTVSQQHYTSISDFFSMTSLRTITLQNITQEIPWVDLVSGSGSELLQQTRQVNYEHWKEVKTFYAADLSGVGPLKIKDLLGATQIELFQLNSSLP